MLDPKMQALAIAKKLVEAEVSPSERFGLSIVIASAGLGAALSLIKSGAASQMQALSLRGDLQDIIKSIDEAIGKH